MMGTTVKTERHDDAEINAMAKKIAEQNRQKVMTAGTPIVGPNGQVTYARPGQPAIHNYMNRPGGAAGAYPGGRAAPGGVAGAPSAGSSSSGGKEDEKKVDAESRKGRFGWCSFEKNDIPYIFR